jgi:hypothetical protein
MRTRNTGHRHHHRVWGEASGGAQDFALLLGCMQRSTLALLFSSSLCANGCVEELYVSACDRNVATVEGSPYKNIRKQSC